MRKICVILFFLWPLIAAAEEAALPKVLIIGDSISIGYTPQVKKELADVAMVVQQASLQSFLSFATNEDYLQGVGHRNAALVDSRILPIRPLASPNILHTPCLHTS